MERNQLVNVAGYTKRLSSCLYQLQQQGCMCDCVVQTKQTHIRVHRIVLMACSSPYLQAEVNRIVNTGGQHHTVDLRAAEYQDVQAIVQLIYTGEMYVTSDNAERLCNLCDFLNLSEAKEICAAFIQDERKKTFGLEVDMHKSSEEVQACVLKSDSINNNTVLSVSSRLLNQVEGRSNQQRTLRRRSAKNMTSHFRSSHTANVEIGSDLPASEGHDPSIMKDKQCNSKVDTDLKLTIKMAVKSDESENDDCLKKFRIDNVVPSVATKSNIEIHTDSHHIKSKLKPKLNKNTVKNQNSMSRTKQKCLKRKLTSQNKCNKNSPTEYKDRTVTTPPAEKRRKLKYSTRTRCRICKTDFEDMKTLNEHRNSAHLLVCSVCSWTSNRGSNMAGHMFVQHGVMYNEEKYPLIHCDFPDCDFKSTKKSIINIHKLRHSDERKFKCAVCGSAFKLKSAYNAHLKTHEPDQLRYECEICGQKFIRPSILKEHKKKHAQNTELCHLCPWSSKSSRELHIHLLKVHSVPLPQNFKVLQCSICDYYTFTNIQLRSHMDLHTGAKKYQCQVCGRLSESELRLRAHLRTHKDIQTELQCPHEGCTYKTKRKLCLQVHINSKHSVPEYKPFQCHLCDYCCKLKGNLDKHLRGIHKLEVMTVNKLWEKVLETGEGYGNIVNRLKGFKTKGAIRMSMEEEEPEDSEQFSEQS